MLLTTILGAVTGIGTTIFDGIMQYKKHKQDQEFQLENKKLDLSKMDKEFEYMVKEAELSMQTMQVQTEGDVKIAEIGAFTEAQKNNKESVDTLIHSDKILNKMLNTTGNMRYVAFPIAYILAALFGIADIFKYIRTSVVFYFVLFLAGVLVIPVATNGIPPLLLMQIYPDIISGILAMFEAIVLFTVGQRANRKIFTK